MTKVNDDLLLALVGRGYDGKSTGSETAASNRSMS